MNVKRVHVRIFKRKEETHVDLRREIFEVKINRSDAILIFFLETIFIRLVLSGKNMIEKLSKESF